MVDALISEQVTVGATPGSPTGDIAPLPGITAVVTARAEKEYVAASYPLTFAPFLRSLPPYIDDLTRDFGDDLYERMLLDPHVAAEVTALKASILETGASLAPAKPDETDDGHDLSVEIRDAAERMLDELSTPFDDALWNLADAIALGNKVAELTYRYDSTYTGRALLVLEKLAVKPRRVTGFVVDAWGNVPGLLAIVPGVSMTIPTGLSLMDITRLPNFLPREKFAIWSYRPKDGDPRGTSLLRPVNNPWWLKQQIWGEYLKYLAQFASGSIVGTTAPNAQTVADPDNPGKTATPQEIMQRRLELLRNGGVISIPNGASVEMLRVQGDGNAFLGAFAFANREITKAILTQSLATEEGQHQTRAATAVHKDVLDTIVRQGKLAATRVIRFDILRPWVRMNWGEKALPLTPKVSLGSTEAEDFPAVGNTVANLTRFGFLHASQYPGLDQWLGLPARDPDWQQTEPAPASAPQLVPAPQPEAAAA